MSTLSEFMLDKTVTQKRKASNTGDSYEAWANVVTNIKMAIYPASSMVVANFQSPYNRIPLSHVGYCLISATVLKAGDRIVEGSNEYLVLENHVFGELYMS